MIPASCPSVIYPDQVANIICFAHYCPLPSVSYRYNQLSKIVLFDSRFINVIKSQESSFLEKNPVTIIFFYNLFRILPDFVKKPCIYANNMENLGRNKALSKSTPFDSALFCIRSRETLRAGAVYRPLYLIYWHNIKK